MDKHAARGAAKQESNMKSMTYGTIPSFEEFKAGFAENMDGMNLYHMCLKGTDYHNMNESGLTVPERYFHSHVNADGLHLQFNLRQLYRLVENLTELHNIDADAEFADWAGSFASSILSTLGFDWI